MYVLFTSGSTGKPKEYRFPHRALANLLESMRVWMKEEGQSFASLMLPLTSLLLRRC